MAQVRQWIIGIPDDSMKQWTNNRQAESGFAEDRMADSEAKVAGRAGHQHVVSSALRDTQLNCSARSEPYSNRKVTLVKAVRYLMLLLLVEPCLDGLEVAFAAPPSPPSTSWPPTMVCSALDGIFAAFHYYPLVGIGDRHGLAQEEDLYVSLIRDKRFAKDVGNVVVEFGDAAQQDTLDRYLSGEDIQYDQLRKVWSDTVGWIPTVSALGYLNFYAQVRAVNLELPPEQRIHVWLGDPPVDWSKIKTKEDLGPYISERNQYPANIINSQILAKNRRALVIYGSFHLRGRDDPGGSYGPETLREYVEDIHPGAFFVVTPYTGFEQTSCPQCFERAAQDWPHPALVTRTARSMRDDQLPVQGCQLMAQVSTEVGPSTAGTQKANELANVEEWISDFAEDAMLYLGPAGSLTTAQESPDLYLDLRFRAEIDRRMFLLTGTHLQPTTTSLVSPRYLHASSGINGGATK